MHVLMFFIHYFYSPEQNEPLATFGNFSFFFAEITKYKLLVPTRIKYKKNQKRYKRSFGHFNEDVYRYLL